MTRCLFACFALLSSACVTGLSLDDRKCPCAEGWQCCAGANVCVEEGTMCPASDGGETASSLAVLAGQPGGSGYADDVGSDARFWYPKAVAGDGMGSLYVVDGENGIRQIDVTSGRVSTAVPFPATGVGYWTSLCVDAGTLYVAGQSNSAVESLWALNLTTQAMSLVAGGGGIQSDGVTEDDGVGSSAGFAGIEGLVCDGAGHVFVADANAPLYERESETPSVYAAIRRVDLASRQVTTIAGGHAGNGAGTGTAAAFGTPAGLSADGMGNLYFADTDNKLLWRYTVATGAVATVGSSFATPAAGFGLSPLSYVGDFYNVAYDQGSADGLALVLGDGVLLGLRSATPDPKFYVEAGTLNLSDGYPVYGATDGPTSTLGAEPIGLSVESGTAYIADSENVVLRMVPSISSSNVVSTLAGLAPNSGDVDGAGQLARFQFLSRLAVDPNGTIFASANDAIRPIDASGRVSTVPVGANLASLAASTSRLFGGSPGTLTVIGSSEPFSSTQISDATTATFTDGLTSFHNLTAIVVDAAGDLYILDSEYATPSSVLKVSGASTIALGAGATHDPSAVVVSKIVDGLDTSFDLALDPAGNLYLAEKNTVKMIAAGTRAITTLAQGDSESVTALAYDPRGFLYFVDGSRVRALTLASGAVSEIAGTKGRQGVKVGALPGSLNSPAGLAVLPNGDLAIADEAENVVLVVHSPKSAIAH
jgi:hypothetical protein